MCIDLAIRHSPAGSSPWPGSRRGSCLPISGVTGEGLVLPGATPGTGVGGIPDGSAVLVPGGTGVPGKPAKDAGPSGTPQPGVSGGILQPSAGTSVGGAGVPAPSGAGTGVQQPGGVGVGTGGKPPKPGFVPGAGGYPYGGTYGLPYGVGTGPGVGTGTGAGVLPGAKPLKPPVGGAGGVGGGVGIPLAAGGYQGGYRPYHQGYGQGGLTYPSAVGLGGGAGAGAKPPKPGYGNLGGGGGYQPGAVPVAPGYGGGYPQQYYPGGYVPAPLTPQQAKAAKYGPLQGFLGGAGGGGVYRGGVAGCQGKYCGRRK